MIAFSDLSCRGGAIKFATVRDLVRLFHITSILFTQSRYNIGSLSTAQAWYQKILPEAMHVYIDENTFQK